jgi:cytochrome c-type biogenesis protein CcmH/NrfG
MQAAIERHDPAAECYYRGVGLWAVVSSRSRTAPFDRDLRERTLCQAAAALRDSTRQRPEHARSHVYLAIVLSDLGEQAAARQALQTARRCPPLGLTDRERTVLLEADK